MSLPALPLFHRVSGQPVVLLGHGEAADAKRRLLERAGHTGAPDRYATGVDRVQALHDQAACGGRANLRHGRRQATGHSQRLRPTSATGITFAFIWGGQLTIFSSASR